MKANILTSAAVWQTDYWAVIIIAVNTCLQSSGSLLGLDPKLSILAKSSPCFCFADSLVVCAQLIYYSFKCGPRPALRLIANARKQHKISKSHQQNFLIWLVARGLLLLATLTQAVRAFTVQNTLWFQACAAAFLFNYLVNTVVNIFGKPFPNQLKSKELDSPREEVWPSYDQMGFFRRHAAIGQLIVWASALSGTISQTHQNAWPRPFYYFAMLVSASPLSYAIILLVGLFYGSIILNILTLAGIGMSIYTGAAYVMIHYCPVVVSIVSSILRCSNSTLAWVLGFIVGVAIVLYRVRDEGVVYIEMAGEVADPYVEHMSKIVLQTKAPPGMVACYIGVTFCAFHLLGHLLFFGYLARRTKLSTLGVTRTALSVTFMFCCNIVACTLYYAHRSDSTGMTLRSWIR